MSNFNRTFRATSLALACGIFGTAALAAGTLSKGDRTFIEKAAGGGMFEVKVSQMATEKAADPAVKSFAEMLVKDHTAANEKLKQIAQQKSVQLPTAMPKKQQHELDKLSKKSGADFDRSYIAEVGLSDHHQDIEMFEKESKKGQDADVTAFATNTLPTLQKHLQAAEQLKGSARATGVGISPMQGTTTKNLTKS